MPKERKKTQVDVVPIQQVDIYTEVRQRLSDLIENYQPGDKLPSERDLAEALDVSRVVVREAMKVLEYMGKVEIRHGAGTFATHPTPEPLVGSLIGGQEVDSNFLENLSEARAALETAIVELAIERATEDDWAALEAVLDRNVNEHLTDEEIGSLSLIFEQAIARAAGNPVLSALQRAIHELWVVAWGRAGLAPADKFQLHNEHLAVLEAMRAGDTDRAVELMRDHVDRSLVSAMAMAKNDLDG